MYGIGWGIPQNKSEAMKWYRLAAEQGNANAQNALGSYYEQGEVVPKDHAEAIKWFRKAAEQGHEIAQANLDSEVEDSEED